MAINQYGTLQWTMEPPSHTSAGNAVHPDHLGVLPLAPKDMRRCLWCVGAMGAGGRITILPSIECRTYAALLRVKLDNPPTVTEGRGVHRSGDAGPVQVWGGVRWKGIP